MERFQSRAGRRPPRRGGLQARDLGLGKDRTFPTSGPQRPRDESPAPLIPSPKSRIPVLNAIVDADAALRVRMGAARSGHAPTWLRGGASCRSGRRAFVRGASRPVIRRRCGRPLRRGAGHRQRPRRVAKLAGADGVHLGQDDLAPGGGRSILGPDAVIGPVDPFGGAGGSCRRAEPVDYIAIGPVFETATKSDRVMPRLVSRRSPGPPKPGGVRSVAIGGISLENASAVMARRRGGRRGDRRSPLDGRSGGKNPPSSWPALPRRPDRTMTRASRLWGASSSALPLATSVGVGRQSARVSVAGTHRPLPSRHHTLGLDRRAPRRDPVAPSGNRAGGVTVPVAHPHRNPAPRRRAVSSRRPSGGARRSHTASAMTPSSTTWLPMQTHARRWMDPSPRFRKGFPCWCSRTATPDSQRVPPCSRTWRATAHAVLSVVHPYEVSAATLAGGRVVTMLNEAGTPVAPVAETLAGWRLEDETMAAVTKATNRR